VYARRTVDGRVLDFGVSGKLLMNALVMYDRQTESLWSQLLGRAVEGPLAGTELEPFPAIQTTWANWRALHPSTMALRTGGWRGDDPYTDYFDSPAAGVMGETRRDERRPAKALVTGALIGGQAVAYPWSDLARARVANDEVAGVGVLVVHDPRVRTTTLFERDAGGRRLTFSAAPGGAEPLVLEDAETGTRWLAWTGAAIDGPLAGRTLARIPATTAFWFAWKDYYPNTRLFTAGAGG